MLVIRSARTSDLDALIEMARLAGSGMTTLKPDSAMLGSRLRTAEASFAESIAPEQRDYIFVLETVDGSGIAGVCAIKGAVGVAAPFYSYRIGTQVHCSDELKVFTRMQTLEPSNDLTGSTELCSLFVLPRYRRGFSGKCLSISRFLLIAQFPHLFTGKIIAEMRGYRDDAGNSPFYEGLARHFFKADFDEIDALTALGKKSFIAELLPRQPLYVDFLPQPARAAIGQVHASTVPARRLLEQEGMHFDGYVDIFDAGPVLQGRASELRAVRDSVPAVAEEGVPGDDTEHMLVSNTKLNDFRLILTRAEPGAQYVRLSARELSHLRLREGDDVRTLLLNPRKRVND